MTDFYTPKAERDAILKALTTELIPINLKCLQSHYGLQKSEVSTIIAPPSCGKSTLVKSMILELLRNKVRTHLFISEETCSKYTLPILTAMENFVEQWGNPFNLTTEEMIKSLCMNISIDSQHDMNLKDRTMEGFLARLDERIRTDNVEVVLFDNFSTSFMGHDKIDRQAEAVDRLKEMAIEHNIVLLMVVHTQKGVNIYRDLITGENARGSANTNNVTSYSYILKTYFKQGEVRSFVTIDKSRYHNEALKQTYELIFDPKYKLFLSDKLSSFEKEEQFRKGKPEIEIALL